ncbi:MAG: bifunctional oligoribonuclease/PAP phosphatase NrnA [Synergistaceae bacterium]|nr:bifunctional oligoribonuclease/PAP phosphatase NrnA [Synergistaceae bacterium]
MTKKMKPANTARSPEGPALTRERLLQVARTLEAASSWRIFSHQKLDGDAIGAAAALFEAGALQGKRVVWMGPDPVPPSYLFLPHTEEYVARKEYRFDSEDDIYVFLDSANENRGVKGLYDRTPKASVLNIDHHEDNSLYGTLNLVDASASSTSELIWRLMTEAGWPITAGIAECLYTGISADTGGFVFSNTTELTYRAAAELVARGASPSKIDTAMRQSRSLAGMRLWGAALSRTVCWGEALQFAMTWLTREDFERTGAIASDTEMLVNQPLLIRGVRFATLLVEEEGGNEVKVSFRSKEGSVAASTVARSLGGGGHPRASAAILALPLDQAIETIRRSVESAYAEWASADR